MGHLKNTVLQAAQELLGFSSKKNKDWFDENNWEKQQLFGEIKPENQAHLTYPFCP